MVQFHLLIPAVIACPAPGIAEIPAFMTISNARSAGQRNFSRISPIFWIESMKKSPITAMAGSLHRQCPVFILFPGCRTVNQYCLAFLHKGQNCMVDLPGIGGPEPSSDCQSESSMQDTELRTALPSFLLNFGETASLTHPFGILSLGVPQAC